MVGIVATAARPPSGNGLMTANDIFIADVDTRHVALQF